MVKSIVHETWESVHRGNEAVLAAAKTLLKHFGGLNHSVAGFKIIQH